ncbi:MAG: gliding motility-associated C-terminal domain-containing protein, partial [Saprospiraceae bacterium]|nr:gliding motility-associated C-terminal domain-containing protein [Saprospiraceae bacterium]
DIYTFTLNVLPPQFTNVNASICEGQIYWVGTPGGPGSQALFAGGVYNVTIPTVNGGCDSTVTVNLTVHPNEFILITEAICQGESVTIPGLPTQYNSTGVYVVNQPTPFGCNRQTVLNLTVYPVPAPVTLSPTICFGDEYVVDGTIFLNQSGTYQFVLESAGGCDSIVNINLTERPQIVTNLVRTICAGQSFTIGTGPPITTSGNYTRVLTSLATGCDSTVNLNLTVRAPIVSTVNATICQGESYTIGGMAFSTQGTHQRVVPSLATGCDSTITLNLTVLPNRFTTLTETICSDETYSVGNSTYDMSGTYRDTLVAANGCDSIVTLNLTVLGAITGATNVTICDGETYTLGGTTFDTDGVYQVTLTSVNGCDSLVTLDLEVLEIPSTTFDEDICEGEIFTFNGTPYTASGTYVETFQSSNGCDSIVTLNLNVIQPLTTLLNIGICTGQTYSVGPNTYDTQGTYVNTLVAASGCDSIVTLNLTVADILEGFGAVEICEGEVYSAGGMNFTATGLYDIPSVTSTGCDSIFHLDLTVHPIPVTNLVESICDDESFTVGTSTYTTTGVYQNTLTSLATGCDSIVNLNLTVLNTPDVTLNISICDGESFTVGTTPYTQPGTYTQTFTATNGCDSTVTLNLVILNVPVTNLVESICDGETYTVGTSDYTTTGVYQDVLVAANGCDSIVNLDLTVLDVPETNLNELICDGETFTVGTSSYTVSGVYQDVLVAANGCDSIVTLNLTVAPIPVTNIVTSICNGATYEVGNSSYSATGMYSDTLTSAVGCDSIVNLNLTITSFYQINLVESICEGETFTVGTTIYDETGMYSNMFVAQDGCDSFVNLNLTVLPVPVTDLTETICDGETYTVGTSDYTVSGTYQDILVAANGCDSIVNLVLTVNPVFVTDLTEFICDGESYSVGSSSYTVSGVYQDILTASNGCDSTVNLNLTVHPIPVTNLTEVVCFGDSYTVGSSTYTASGTYQDVLTAATGCDSIVNLNLTVNPVYAISLTELICDDETFTVGNTSFNSTGTFVVPLQSASGCDSIVTLNLTTHPCELSFSTLGTAARCSGNADGSYRFSVTVGTAPYTYTWQGIGNPLTGSGNIAANNTNAFINNLPAGNYRITVTDSYSIAGIINFTITQPPALNASIALSDHEGFNISCAGGNDGSATASAVGGTAPYSYAWSTGLNTATIEDLTLNTYSVTVTDQNGCSTTTQASLTAPEPLSVEAEVTDPLCYGDSEGFINVSKVIGGVGPFVYAINNGPFTVSPVFGNLGIGTYQIQVQDANGCETEITETVNQPQELIVDLGPDIQISLGDSIRLPAQTTYPVVSYNWKIDPALSCTDCYDPLVRPFETAAFSVVVTDENGCTDTDAITIFVAKNREVFIPNVFSPNEDGFNDVLYIQAGPEVARIKAFKVFNRWGEAIIELDNFQPNDPAYGWNGTHRGQLMNAAVFVYFAEVEFIDGEVRLFKGDVVLMR